MNSAFPQRRRRGLSPDLTPLIDVVFQLLVFFLLTTTFTLTAIPLDLPVARTGAVDAGDAPLILSITKDERVFIGESLIPDERLMALLRERLALNADLTVQIRGDVEASYGRLVEVLDACRAAGIQQVALEARPATPEEPPR
jgi:biopolymer transport protein ExbD